MGIYRGPGGTGDAVADSSSEALLIRELAIEVQADADAAAASAASANSSDLDAQTQAAAALASKNAAATSATNAATSATNAANSETSAASSATDAETAQTAAETAQSAAATSATNAANSASAASTSASNASTSATNAASSASSASTSASSASTSATNAASSATAAAGSATSASSSASSASTSATNAATSATSAAGSATTATTQAGLAATSASNAATSETNAASSASAASTSASNAATSATTATTQATNASTSATSAASSATAAAASYDSFDDRYLGVKSSAPTLDNDGNALLNGALYFDSVLAAMRVYNTATATWATIQQGVTNTDPVRHSVRPSLLLDFANTKTLDPRITFTRASTGTFYDGKTVAKAEENLVSYSQQIDDASWGKTNVTVTANNTTAPDGTTTAELVAETSATGVHFIEGGSISRFTSVSGQAYSFSGFFKKGVGATAPDVIQLSYGNAGFANTVYVNYNLQAGTVSSAGAGVTSSSITSVGSGWYRCAFTANANSSASSTLAFFFVNNDGNATRNPSYAGATTADVYVWGVQVEQRSSVTAYTATTTAPITNYIPALQTAASGAARFDHNPTTGESLGLLIEEQRTNLLTYSEQFDNAAWTKIRASVTANVIIAPDGTLTGDKLVEDTTATATHPIGEAATVTASTSATFSVYLKAGERSWAMLSPTGTSATYAYFNLATGVVGSTGGTNPPTATSVTAVGNGWYRCSLTYVSPGATTYYILPATSGTGGQYTGDGYSGIYIWGAQLEAASFATSYIPTVASQVTRSADAASMTGTNFSSWYRADEGTLYGESVMSNVVSKNFWSLSDNTLNEYFQLNTTSGGVSRISVVDNGTTQASLLSATLSANTMFKASFAYKVNDFAFTVNAGTVQIDTSGTLPAIDRIYIGGGHSGGVSIGGTVSKLAYYPKRLTNAELQGLTTV